MVPGTDFKGLPVREGVLGALRFLYLMLEGLALHAPITDEVDPEAEVTCLCEQIGKGKLLHCGDPDICVESGRAE